MEGIAVLIQLLGLIIPDAPNIKEEKTYRKVRRYSCISYAWYCFYRFFLIFLGIFLSLIILIIFPNYWGITGTLLGFYFIGYASINFFTIVQARKKPFKGIFTDREYKNLTKKECNYRLTLQLIATFGCFTFFLAGFTTFESNGLIWFWGILFAWPPFLSLYDMYQKYQEWRLAQSTVK
ncbi:hypothetical protein [Wohlfahrtiimonas populi]|uniref:hypothetical protein n=1 Tax=Wohlfahrtiimonas populi TaxID=1940240 RepID=UPI00098D3289|nr:hypothetical protein [Wohlfahrtiimonas populi]